MIGTTNVRYLRGPSNGRSQDGVRTFVRLEFGEADAEWYLANERVNGHAKAATTWTGRRPLVRSLIGGLLSRWARPREPEDPQPSVAGPTPESCGEHGVA